MNKPETRSAHSATLPTATAAPGSRVWKARRRPPITHSKTHGAKGGGCVTLRWTDNLSALIPLRRAPSRKAKPETKRRPMRPRSVVS